MNADFNFRDKDPWSCVLIACWYKAGRRLKRKTNVNELPARYCLVGLAFGNSPGSQLTVQALLVQTGTVSLSKPAYNKNS